MFDWVTTMQVYIIEAIYDDLHGYVSEKSRFDSNEFRVNYINIDKFDEHKTLVIAFYSLMRCRQACEYIKTTGSQRLIDRNKPVPDNLSFVPVQINVNSELAQQMIQNQKRVCEKW